MLSSRPFDQWVLMASVILAGLADQFRIVQLGPISGLAALTFAGCCVVWCCWLKEPWSPVRNGGIVSLVLFNIWALGTLLWAPATLQDALTLTVFLLFLGLLLLSVREGRRDPQLPNQLGRALDWMSGIGAAVCVVQAFRGDTDVESSLTSARSVAIVLLVGLCYQLAAWQHGQRGRLLVAGGMVVAIIASLSRMASVVAIVLFPMAMVLGGRHRFKAVRLIQVLVVGGGLISCLFLYEPIYERMFGSRSAADIATEGINSSGRIEMWDEIFESFQQHMWLGQGAGSTRPYTDRPGMFHPHNDYLLLAHDYGLLGMGLFLLGLGISIAHIARYLRRSGSAAASRDAGDTLCLAGLLALVMLLLAMITDNAINYAFVMAPLAVLLGVSLAHSDRAQHLGLDRTARATRATRSSPTGRGKPVCRSGMS